MGRRKLPYIAYESHLLANKMELMWFYVKFPDALFAIPLCLCHRRIIYADLMVLEEILQVYMIHTETQPHTTPH